MPTVSKITKLKESCSYTKGEPPRASSSGGPASPGTPDKLEYNIQYVVEFDRTDSPGTAGHARIAYWAGDSTHAPISIHRFGERYPSRVTEPGTFLEDIKCDFLGGDAYAWSVTEIYRSLGANEDTPAIGGSGEGSGEAFSLPKPRMSGGSHSEEFEADHDIGNNAIANSAGQLYDPPYKRFRGGLRFSVTNYVESLNLHAIANYADKPVNDGPFKSFAAGTVLLDGVDIEALESQHEDRTIAYWQITYNFIYRPTGWDLRVTDEGSLRLATPINPTIESRNPDDPNELPMTCSPGNPSADRRFGATQGATASGKRELLNGRGRTIESGGRAHILRFRMNRRMDFNALNIQFPQIQVEI